MTSCKQASLEIHETVSLLEEFHENNNDTKKWQTWIREFDRLVEFLGHQPVTVDWAANYRWMIGKMGDMAENQQLKEVIALLVTVPLAELESNFEPLNSINKMIEDYPIASWLNEFFDHRLKICQVFISYSHHDKEFVNRLDYDLGESGISVWIDEKKIKVGDSISKKIEHGISICDFFLMVISKHSVNSKWVEREYRAALNIQVSSGIPKIIPLLIQDVKLPLLLDDIKYADFSKSYNCGFLELLKALKEQ